MDTRQKDIEKLKDYKYGFSTDIENIKAPKGLNEDIIRFISNIKKEPQWMLDFRLKAFERFKLLKEPNWQKPKYPKIDYQDLYYYSAPKSMKDKPKSLDELDPKLLETYKKLGIPLQEQARLNGIAVDAVFDSVSVATTFKEELTKNLEYHYKNKKDLMVLRLMLFLTQYLLQQLLKINLLKKVSFFVLFQKLCKNILNW